MVATVLSAIWTFLRAIANAILKAIRWVLAVEGVLLLANGMLGGEQTVSTALSCAIGIINMIGAFDLRQQHTETAGRKPWQVPTVIVGQASAVPYLLVPLLTERNTTVHDAPDLAICAAAIAGLLVALAILTKVVTTRVDPSIGKAWALFLEIVPLASSAQFYYTNIYVPSHQRPNVNIEASLKLLSHSAGISRIEATANLTNDGRTGLEFFDALYTVTGFGLTPLEAPIPPSGVTSAESADVAFQDTDQSYKGLLKVGRLIRPGGHLEPDQELQTTFVMEVADRVQDKVRLTVFLSTLADAGDTLNTKRCKSVLPDPSSCEETPIPIQGWLSGTLGDHPVARTSLVYKAGQVPSLRTQFYYEDSGPTENAANDAKDVYGYFDSRRFTTSTEIAISP